MDIFYLPISIRITPQPHHGLRLALGPTPQNVVFGKMRVNSLWISLF